MPTEFRVARVMQAFSLAFRASITFFARVWISGGGWKGGGGGSAIGRIWLND